MEHNWGRKRIQKQSKKGKTKAAGVQRKKEWGSLQLW